MTQPETGWVLVETHVPNPLSKLITIYSDDERPESSHDNLLHVQEEKGPEKTSSLAPEVQKKEVPQKEIEAESGLKTKEPNTLETKANLKDKPELNEPNKESLRKEISSFVTNKQVSYKFVPNVTILLNTQTPDERQVEVKSSRHTEEVQEPDLEQVYTIGSLGNILTWGDQQIPELVDKVAYIYAISYDRKRKSIVQRTAKK
jgi:hypothetical protein